MLTKRQTCATPDTKTDEVDNFAEVPAADSPLSVRKPSPASDMNNPTPSPARHLQEDLSKMIALQAHNSYAEDKYPVKWTLLGLAAFCSIAWLVAGRLVFGL